MGEIIKGICKCGYQTKELKFGAGMADFEHSRTVPAISMMTADIVELDILAKSPNPQLVPYTDPRLHDQNCTCTRLEAWDTLLPTERNYCPGCHQFSLGFESLGLYD